MLEKFKPSKKGLQVLSMVCVVMLLAAVAAFAQTSSSTGTTYVPTDTAPATADYTTYATTFASSIWVAVKGVMPIVVSVMGAMLAIAIGRKLLKRSSS